MKLLTEEQKAKFKKFPLYSQDGKGLEAEVVVKYFFPLGSATWLITEGEQVENGDWRLFGYMYLFEWEWGYVMLSELKEINMNGVTIERDLYLDDKTTVRECLI